MLLTYMLGYGLIDSPANIYIYIYIYIYIQQPIPPQHLKNTIPKIKLLLQQQLL